MTDSTFSKEAASALAPGGRLRASINMGNALLAHRDPATGEPAGVSVDLANALAGQLGVELELVVFDKAVLSVEAVRDDRADVGFFAIDPARSEGLLFTRPYLLIEGSYLVGNASPLQENDAVDRPGIRIGVASGSAYDLFLTRELRAASIERFLSAEMVLDALQSGQVDVAAGIRAMLEVAARGSDLRLLPGRFMVIEQAMGTNAGHGAVAGEALSAFVEWAKASGFVAAALARHNVTGGVVAG